MDSVTVPIYSVVLLVLIIPVVRGQECNSYLNDFKCDDDCQKYYISYPPSHPNYQYLGCVTSQRLDCCKRPKYWIGLLALGGAIVVGFIILVFIGQRQQRGKKKDSKNHSVQNRTLYVSTIEVNNAATTTSASISTSQNGNVS